MAREPLYNKKQKVVTLFIENLPESLYWQGLWHAFGRHDEVVDAFIARKRSRRGRRFGFVRFANMLDAERAMERLNGFALCGSRMSVSLAKFNTRQDFWRRVSSDETKIHETVQPSRRYQNNEGIRRDKEEGETSHQNNRDKGEPIYKNFSANIREVGAEQKKKRKKKEWLDI
ncbi:hypothetical protein V6N13_088332 [Hibiscus sabdariffa]